MKYLALGDSYTIGESVDYSENFPSQTAQLLNQEGLTEFKLCKLIAVTGWTTDELAKAIASEKPSHDFDWVTLLIGVNNQYRNRSAEEYSWQLYSLMCQSILFAKGNPKQVIVLSIPDWGLTPFNKDRDKTETSAQIDAYNAINMSISQEMGCHYIDITTSTRLHAEDTDYLANDLLHYSKKEYAIWANKVAEIIKQYS
jgi:lysophospholipase L1-like esterase